MTLSLLVLAVAMPQLPMSHSADSRDLYAELRTYPWGCPKDDEATKKQEVAHVVQVAKAIKDDFDRGQFVGFATQLQAWFDENDAGIPDVGSWNDLTRQFQAARAAFDALPAQVPTGPDAVRAAIAIYAAIHRESDAVSALFAKMGDSPCQDYPGQWGVLVHDGTDAVYAADEQVKAGANPALDAYRAWQQQKAILDEPVPTTYWEHLEQTGKLIDLVQSTEALAPQLADLAAWAPALSGDDATAAAGAADQAAAVLAQAQARAVAQLPDVKMPKLPKNAAGAKLVKKVLDGQPGKMMGQVVGPKGTSKDTWNEDVEVKRDTEYVYTRNYTFVREYYSTYYAWKPSTPPAVTLPGIDAGDVCEVWQQSFFRYTKGSPDVQKKWGPYQSWKEGYVLCKNAGATSKLKIK